MRTILLRSSAAFAFLALAGAAAPPPDAPQGQEIVVTGQRYPIVVNGRSIRCRKLPDDPQDEALARLRVPAGGRKLVLLPRADGQGFELVDDHEQLGGPGVWRRSGTGIDQYVFRAPENGSPMCIGSRTGAPEGFGQLRQMVDAAPYRGKRVRFTAWVASRKAVGISFWLTALNPAEPWSYTASVEGREHVRRKGIPWRDNPGDPKFGWIYNGAAGWNHVWDGSHGWTPMMIETGPVSDRATQLSFGFQLWGAGDVWLYNPKLEAVALDDPYQRKGDVFVIGTDRQSGRR